MHNARAVGGDSGESGDEREGTKLRITKLHVGTRKPRTQDAPPREQLQRGHGKCRTSAKQVQSGRLIDASGRRVFQQWM